MDYMGLVKFLDMMILKHFLKKNKKSRIVLMTTKAKNYIIILNLKKMICFYLEEKVQEFQKIYTK